MKTTTLKIFLVALAFFPRLGMAAETAGASIAGLDLFTFPLSAVGQELGKRAASLSKALMTAFPKESLDKDIGENNYGGRCFVSGSDQYELEWMDSETEGFRFTVDKLKDQKGCTSPFNSNTYKTSRLNPANFFPISHSHPALQIGVSTPDLIKKEFGVPAYASPQQLIYVLQRDKKKEKGCEYKTNKGELAAVEVQFNFVSGVLKSVSFINSIAGEC